METIECSLRAGEDLPRCDDRVAALYRYWQSIAPGPGVLPGRQHFDAMAVPRLLPWVWLVDVYREPLRFKYRLLGTEQVNVIGRDHTGRWVEDVLPDFTESPWYWQFEAVVGQGMATFRAGFPMIYVPKDYLRSERLLLPLARNGHDVDIVLALTVFQPAQRL